VSFRRKGSVRARSLVRREAGGRGRGVRRWPGRRTCARPGTRGRPRLRRSMAFSGRVGCGGGGLQRTARVPAAVASVVGGARRHHPAMSGRPRVSEDLCGGVRADLQAWWTTNAPSRTSPWPASGRVGARHRSAPAARCRAPLTDDVVAVYLMWRHPQRRYAGRGHGRAGRARQTCRPTWAGSHRGLTPGQPSYAFGTGPRAATQRHGCSTGSPW
jgi:hypothetical protein